MAPAGHGTIDIFSQLNDLFHEPEEGEPKEEPYCYNDVGFLKQLLEKERELLSKVGQENIDLLKANETQKDESFIIQEAQIKEIQDQKARIEELEAVVKQRNQDLEHLQVDSAIQLFEECQKLKMKNHQLEDTMGKKIEELKTIILGVESFRERQVEVERRMEIAENHAIKTQAEMEKIIPDLERNFIEKCSVYEKDFEKKLQKLKISLTAEVEDRVSERTKCILADNEQLLEDVKIHMGATSGLAKQRDNLQAQTLNLASEIDLLKQTGDLYIQRGIAQGRAVEQHQSKLLILERSLRQVIRQYSAERSELESAHQQVLAELTSEKHILGHLVQNKTKEVKRLKHLVDHMVSQRNEVETFLIESLEHVKAQIAAGYKVGNRGRDSNDKMRIDDDDDLSCSNASTMHLPSIKSTSHSWPGANIGRSELWSRRSRKSKHLQHDFELHLHELPDTSNLKSDFVQVTPKVDISNLSWSDREKVLRYLFLKINHSHAVGVNHPTESQCKIARIFSIPLATSEARKLLA